MSFSRLVRYKDEHDNVSYGDLLYGTVGEGFLVKRLVGDLSVGFRATDQEEPTIVHNVRSNWFMKNLLVLLFPDEFLICHFCSELIQSNRSASGTYLGYVYYSLCWPQLQATCTRTRGKLTLF